MSCKCIQLERDTKLDGTLSFIWKDASHMAALLCYGPTGLDAGQRPDLLERTIRMPKEGARIVWHQLMKVGWTPSGPAFKLTAGNAPEYKHETHELKEID